jgi:tetratricopeptide (TPR) repeat protein
VHVTREYKGDLAGAIADYDRAIELDPRLAFAYRNRGNARLKKGDLAGAIADYEAFLKLAPNHPSAPEARALVAKLRAGEGR